MGFSVRPFSETDWPALRGVFSEVYRANPRLQERDYFEWQYGGQPGGDGPDYTFLILEEGGRIEGFVGYVPASFYCDGEIVDGCWVQNWYSSRGGGVGLVPLMQVMKDWDRRFMIGVSSSAISIYELYRIPILSEIPRWIGVLDPERLCELLDLTDATDRRRMDSSRERLRGYRDVAGISSCRRFDPEDSFDFAKFPRLRGYTHRSGSFLNWRYFDIPRHDYRALRDEDGGFAIYRTEVITGYDDRVVRILEWNFSGDAAARAWSKIAAEALEAGAVLVDFFCTSRDVGDVFRDLGFVPETEWNSPIPHLFRPLHHAPGIGLAIDLPPHRKQRELDFGEWYITKGDGDADRIKL